MARRVYNRFCPLSLALEEVGDRWTLHIVYALLSGPRRYVELKNYLDGAGSNVLADRLRRLADAHIVGRRTGDRPGSETTYYLSARGLALAPAISALAQWGIPLLTLSNTPADDRSSDDVFDQTWAVPDASLLENETYQWTVDGVQIKLRVTGRLLHRTHGRARNPAASLTTTSTVLGALAAGDTSASTAQLTGGLILTGSPEAIRRMLIVTGLPPGRTAAEA
jgi:DNA-binding HxlR family transcriptional regulator